MIASPKTQAPDLNANSMERLVPDEVQSGDVTGESSLALHLARYEFAAKHVRPGRLLDISCGVGYGTKLLVDANDTITDAFGVDIDASAIAYAQKRYASDNISFVVDDALQFENDPFDTIVSLETIEHLDNPARFIGRMAELLSPNGIFIGSVPTTPSVDANPHHKSDFSERSFRQLFLRQGLRELASFRQIQPFQPLPLLSGKEARAGDLRPNLPLYYFHNPVSLLRRVGSTIRFGFTNRYITIVWSK